MADAFEKVELTKPELTVWLAADGKRDGRLCMNRNYILRKN